MAESDEFSTVSSATLLQARQGNEDAWRSIWTRYSSRIFRQALRFGIRLADAEDITIEVFRKVWLRLEDFSRNGSAQSLGAWINRITQNSTLDFLKRRRREPQDLGSAAELLAAPGQSDSNDAPVPSPIWLALWRAQGIVENESSDRAWECFRLVRFARLPHAEIGEILGMSTTNVSTTANRVFQKIRQECILQLQLANVAVDDDGRLIVRDPESAV